MPLCICHQAVISTHGTTRRDRPTSSESGRSATKTTVESCPCALQLRISMHHRVGFDPSAKTTTSSYLTSTTLRSPKSEPRCLLTWPFANPVRPDIHPPPSTPRRHHHHLARGLAAHPIVGGVPPLNTTNATLRATSPQMLIPTPLLLCSPPKHVDDPGVTAA